MRVGVPTLNANMESRLGPRDRRFHSHVKSLGLNILIGHCLFWVLIRFPISACGCSHVGETFHFRQPCFAMSFSWHGSVRHLMQQHLGQFLPMLGRIDVKFAFFLSTFPVASES